MPNHFTFVLEPIRRLELHDTLIKKEINSLQSNIEHLKSEIDSIKSQTKAKQKPRVSNKTMQDKVIDVNCTSAHYRTESPLPARFEHPGL
jgi:predicted RNase H-like nuclease (RuvC/YqgF family)